ncbi:murein biosynthesis integral membrane protein MurJ [Methylobacterium nigriterrae]|uniref:murein biosynthesis integral membrane protein MurJ n=1 Tax=Methylobacterium nigriterrae TaxID=3127512 RepID=UPI0030140F5F
MAKMPAVRTQYERGTLDGLAADTRTVAIGILASRITGFGRVAVMGAVFGPTYFGNLFQFSSTLPVTVYSFLMGVLMSAFLVPPLVRCIQGNDVAAVRRFANAALGSITAVLTVAGIVALLGLPLLLGAVTFGIEDPLVRDRYLVLGVALALMQMPQIVLYGVVGTGVAVQQAYGRFALAAAAPAIENIGIITVLAISAATFGRGVDVESVGSGQIMLLGLGTTAAVAAHAGVQWWGAYRLGVALVPRPGDWSETEVRTILRQGSSLIGYAGSYWAAFLVALVSAGSVPGGLIAFQMAANLCNFPVTLTAVPLAAAQLPRLSGSHHHDRLADFRRTYWAGLRLLIFFALPASVLFAFVPHTLACALAFGEMRGPTGTALLAASIGGLGIGIVGDAAMTLMTSSCYARNDKSAPQRAMLLRLIVIGTGVVLARWTLAGPELLWALGAAVSAGNILAGAYLHAGLRRALGATELPGALGIGQIAITAAALVPTVVVANWIAADDASAFRTIGGTIGALAASGIVYLVLHCLRGSLELELLFPMIGRLPLFGWFSAGHAYTTSSRPREAEQPMDEG